MLAVGAEMRNYNLLFEAVDGLDARVLVKASSAWMASARQDVTAIPPNVELIAGSLSYTELRDLYAGAALVVLPLYDTPQAAGITTILEAMAMRKCVVATRSSGLPDNLVDGQTGVICDPTPEALAAALSDLLVSPERRARLAQAGYESLDRGFTLEAHAAAVSSFLVEIASNREWSGA